MAREQANQVRTNQTSSNSKPKKTEKALAKEKKQQAKMQRAEKREKKREQIPARVRIFPIWLRLLIMIALLMFALVAGLMIGFGVLGDGEPLDALKVETWQHIIDIIAEE